MDRLTPDEEYDLAKRLIHLYGLIKEYKIELDDAINYFKEHLVIQGEYPIGGISLYIKRKRWNFFERSKFEKDHPEASKYYITPKVTIELHIKPTGKPHGDLTIKRQNHAIRKYYAKKKDPNQ